MLRKHHSVFDIFKIGIGPSEVFTLGPWLAAQRFLKSLEEKNEIQFVRGIKILLYGPVAKNCKVYRTEEAIVLGLSGYGPLSFNSEKIEAKIEGIRKNSRLFLHGMFDTPFDLDSDIICLENEVLSFNQNALTFLANVIDGQIAETYYLTGHSSVVCENEVAMEETAIPVPFPIHDAGELISCCETKHKKVSDLVFENEKSLMPLPMIRITAKNIWTVMQESIYRGCSAENSRSKVLLEGKAFTDYSSWIEAIRKGGNSFSYILDWIGCFALAVEAENASMGKIVAAPTNGVAGIVAAVLQYYRIFCVDRDTDIIRFLLTAGQIGHFFKSACSDYALATAMAAAGLTELLGGSVTEVITAAETAIEQSQHPDTNSIGAVKSIIAAQIALKSIF